MAETHAPGSVWQLSGIERRSVLIDQAMEMLGVSRRTVYYWIRQGRLRTIRTRCGSQRVLLSSMACLPHTTGPATEPAPAADAFEALDSVGL